MSTEKDGWDIPEKNVPDPVTEPRAVVPAINSPGRYPVRPLFRSSFMLANMMISS
jgi:hypothetical protein